MPKENKSLRELEREVEQAEAVAYRLIEAKEAVDAQLADANRAVKIRRRELEVARDEARPKTKGPK